MQYQIVNPPFTPHFATLSKEELRDYYQWFMKAIPHKVAELAEMVRASPGFDSWDADKSPESLGTLGEWFCSQVQTRPRSKQEIETIAARSPYPIDVPKEELTDRTFAAAMDVAAYFSQILLRHHPTLRWHHSLEGRRSVHYGQPVIVGFGKAEFNPIQVMNTLAYGIASSNKDGTALRKLYDVWSKMVTKS